MSIRLTLYAVDRPALAELLDHTVIEVMRRWVSGCGDAGRALRVRGEAVCYAIPGDRPGSLGRLAADPVLERTMGQVLGAGTADDLDNLLSCLSTCRVRPVVREVSRGHRCWWIGSLVDRARQSRVASRDRVERVAALLRRLVGDHDCGIRLPRESAPAVHLPVVPADDAGRGLATWSAAEWHAVADLVRLTLALPNRRFCEPPEPADDGASISGEWDPWVEEMGRALASVDEIGFDDPVLVSLVDGR